MLLLCLSRSQQWSHFWSSSSNRGSRENRSWRRISRRGLHWRSGSSSSSIQYWWCSHGAYLWRKELGKNWCQRCSTCSKKHNQICLQQRTHISQLLQILTINATMITHGFLYIDVLHWRSKQGKFTLAHLFCSNIMEDIHSASIEDSKLCCLFSWRICLPKPPAIIIANVWICH